MASPAWTACACLPVTASRNIKQIAGDIVSGGDSVELLWLRQEVLRARIFLASTKVDNAIRVRFADTKTGTEDAHLG